MAENHAGWGFYGRANELYQLERRFLTPTFDTISVVGGRGVGKTELIREAARSLKGRKPYIHIELPDVDREDSESERLKDIADVNRVLRDKAVAAGLGDALPSQSSTGDYVHQMKCFRAAIECLLRHGAVTVLDEFQNSRELHVLNGVKALIDDLNFERSDAGGKIVLVGSHQQKMLKILFGPAEPMYGRVDLPLRLFPLAAPDVLEMAAAQGWLHKPYRFLTAYAAFGGNPRSWRRFAGDIRSDTLPEPADEEDKTWRQNFAIREIMRINADPNEQFLNNAYADFSEAARNVAIELANNPRGVRWSQIVQKCGGQSEEAAEEVNRGFKILQRHLGIAEFVPENDLFPTSVKKARLTDQTALFELHIEKNWKDPKPGELEQDKDYVLSRVSEMEGTALERLTAEWLRSFGLFEIVQRSMEMPRPGGGQLEIDVIGETGYTPRDQNHIALCSCKRSPGRHHVSKTHDDFNLYLRLRENRGSKWDGVRRFLVSPEWPESALRNDGFERLSCASMARNLGFKIMPWPRGMPPRPTSEFSRPEEEEALRNKQPESQRDSDGLEFDT